MLHWIVGVLLIGGGLMWGLGNLVAAGMASGSTTFWESTGRPLTGLIPIAMGIAVILWR